MIRRRLIITGRVQNVCYRDWMIGQARALGLHGWVRNRADGSVEAVIEGAAATVETMIEHSRQGPPAARIVSVAVAGEAPTEVLEGFERRPTA